MESVCPGSPAVAVDFPGVFEKFVPPKDNCVICCGNWNINIAINIIRKMYIIYK